jgi:hypothetical protein
MADGQRIVGPVKPHHVLVFRYNGTFGPGDKGTYFLNQEKLDTFNFAGMEPDDLLTDWDALAKEYEKI